MVLHDAVHPGRATESGEDFNEKLNIAASALARLLTIYCVDEVSHAHTPIAPDPAAGKFIEGAAAFRHQAGYGALARSAAQRPCFRALSHPAYRLPFARPDAIQRGRA
jgi:hypothetical protein